MVNSIDKKKEMSSLKSFQVINNFINRKKTQTISISNYQSTKYESWQESRAATTLDTVQQNYNVKQRNQ